MWKEDLARLSERIGIKATSKLLLQSLVAILSCIPFRFEMNNRIPEVEQRVG